MLNRYPGGLSSGLNARTSPAEAMRRGICGSEKFVPDLLQYPDVS